MTDADQLVNELLEADEESPKEFIKRKAPRWDFNHAYTDQHTGIQHAWYFSQPNPSRPGWGRTFRLWLVGKGKYRVDVVSAKENREVPYLSGLFDNHQEAIRWAKEMATQYYAEQDKLGESDDPPTRAEIDHAASKTEEPTDGQKEAGNYRKGSIRLYGFDISIENPKGSERSGKDKGGKAWSVTMPSHYGYIKGTQGKDKDHLDVYIGPKPDSEKVWVVNQGQKDGGEFDEHKIMLAFDSKEDALKTYDGAFNDDLGPKLRKSVVETTIDGLKDWIKSGNTKKPFTKQSDESKAAALASALLDAEPEESPKEFMRRINFDPGKKHGYVEDFSISHHGLDGSQFYPGATVAFSRHWDAVFTGAGDNPKEALDDALGSAAEAGWLVDKIDNNEPETPSASAETREQLEGEGRSEVASDNPDLDENSDEFKALLDEWVDEAYQHIDNDVYYYIEVYVKGNEPPEYQYQPPPEPQQGPPLPPEQPLGEADESPKEFLRRKVVAKERWNMTGHTTRADGSEIWLFELKADPHFSFKLIAAPTGYYDAYVYHKHHGILGSVDDFEAATHEEAVRSAKNGAIHLMRGEGYKIIESKDAQESPKEFLRRVTAEVPAPFIKKGIRWKREYDPRTGRISDYERHNVRGMRATRLLRGKYSHHVRYHQTDVLTWDREGNCHTNAGGWWTRTTFERMNSYLPHGWRIHSMQGNRYWWNINWPEELQDELRRMRRWRNAAARNPHWIIYDSGDYIDKRGRLHKRGDARVFYSDGRIEPLGGAVQEGRYTKELGKIQRLRARLDKGKDIEKLKREIEKVDEPDKRKKKRMNLR